MAGTAFAVIAQEGIKTDRLVRALKAAGAGNEVIVAADPGLGIARVHESPIAIFTTVALLGETLSAMGNDRWRVFVLNESPDEHALSTALEDNRVHGLIAWGPEGGRSWELRYLARRMLAPSEKPPHMGSLLGWGATTVVFNPTNTEEQRSTVERIAQVSRRLGLSRRMANATSTAAHELTMNAMYDAPVDASGRVKYALERRKDLQLLPEEVPELRFTISADFVCLDMVDPFGRLPRSRYYEGVLRGHRNLKYDQMELDTSHGGAGLGLHTLYSGGSILRAEIRPMNMTHVSWVIDRNASVKGFKDLPRSLYFLPYLPK